MNQVPNRDYAPHVRPLTLETTPAGDQPSPTCGDGRRPPADTPKSYTHSEEDEFAAFATGLYLSPGPVPGNREGVATAHAAGDAPDRRGAGATAAAKLPARHGAQERRNS